MKTVFGLALLCGGIWLVHSGWTRRASLVGKTERAIVQLGQTIDGKARLSKHAWFLVGGGAMGVAGIALLLAGRKR